MPNDLTFERIPNDANSVYVAILNGDFIGIVSKNLCGWSMYNTAGEDLTGAYRSKKELRNKHWESINGL